GPATQPSAAKTDRAASRGCRPLAPAAASSCGRYPLHHHPRRGIVDAPCAAARNARRVYRFFAARPFWATAAFTSALNAPASTFSPSAMSIALRVLPSKLELNRRDG